MSDPARRIEHRGSEDGDAWPSLPLSAWRDTHATLHMWMQIVGKTRLALAPLQNHWWNVRPGVGATVPPDARFSGRFLGKSSPVHFFWGASDLAYTRFNGRRAPAHAASEWWVLREANSHEEISFGFWPGSGSVQDPAFYAYARPEPSGLADARVQPADAFYSRDLADFILPYDAVRAAPSPDTVVLDFCQSAYDAAADLARWDRAALDRPRAEWP